MAQDIQLFPPDVRPMLDGPFWRVVIRPAQYKPERVPYAKLRETLDRVQVRLRGWYFPHLTNKSHEIEHGMNYYGTWVVFSNYEYWRFYESAQLVHYHGLREHVDEAYRARVAETTKRNLAWQKPDWSRINGYIDIINFLYTVTEMFEFASRLAAFLSVEESMNVQISLNNIEGYILGVSDPSRAWDFVYRCDASNLSNTWVIESNVLQVDSAPLSLAAAQWFFERFGWADVNMTALEDAQAAFLKKRPGY
jgi:hypothetical protein